MVPLLVAAGPETEALVMTVLILGLVAIGAVTVIGLLWISLGAIRDRMRQRRRRSQARKQVDAEAAFRAERLGRARRDTFDESAPLGTAADDPSDR